MISVGWIYQRWASHSSNMQYFSEGRIGSFLIAYLVSVDKYFLLGLMYCPVLSCSIELIFCDLSNSLVSPVYDKSNSI